MRNLVAKLSLKSTLPPCLGASVRDLRIFSRRTTTTRFCSSCLQDWWRGISVRILRQVWLSRSCALPVVLFISNVVKRSGRKMMGKKWKVIGFIFLPNIFLPCTCVFSSRAVPGTNSPFLKENDRDSVRDHRACKVGGEEYLSGCCGKCGLAGAAPFRSLSSSPMSLRDFVET